MNFNNIVMNFLIDNYNGIIPSIHLPIDIDYNGNLRKHNYIGTFTNLDINLKN